MSITWVLERNVFSDNHDRLAEAASASGHQVIPWDDGWWQDEKFPSLEDEYVIFHGSLGNASRIASELPWQPGAFCNTSAFACSSWYTKAKPWLLHENWVFSRVAEFVHDPDHYLKEIGSPLSFFVRPDSPLKPFSGRVIQIGKLSLEALDYGFYYDDENLPIVITPVVDVGSERRFIISGQTPITSSAYETSERSEINSTSSPAVIEFAREVAAALVPPDPLYILDVCQCNDKLRLLEINPFSGGDLYACSRSAIVAAVEDICKGQQIAAPDVDKPRR
jgi:hypothetical protein